MSIVPSSVRELSNSSPSYRAQRSYIVEYGELSKTQICSLSNRGQHMSNLVLPRTTGTMSVSQAAVLTDVESFQQLVYFGFMENDSSPKVLFRVSLLYGIDTYEQGAASVGLTKVGRCACCSG